MPFSSLPSQPFRSFLMAPSCDATVRQERCWMTCQHICRLDNVLRQNCPWGKERKEKKRPKWHPFVSRSLRWILRCMLRVPAVCYVCVCVCLRTNDICKFKLVQPHKFRKTKNPMKKKCATYICATFRRSICSRILL